jgi:hypothetical protein
MVRGWPDKRDSVRTAFRMQELENRRTQLRFEQLLRDHGPEDPIWSSFESVSSVWDRLHSGWASSEEMACKRNDRAYDILTAEIDNHSSRVDPVALEGAFRDAQRDEDYLDARRAMQRRLRESDDQMITLGPRT